MKVRRTISIDKSDLDALKPIMESNGNNLSHALRFLINEHRQRMNMSKISGDKQKLMMIRDQIIENRIAALLPYPLLQWLLITNRCVPPLGTFRVIMEKYTKLFGIENFTLKDYIKLINSHLDIFGYQYRQRIEASPDLKKIKITFEGENSGQLKGTVMNYSCLLSHHPIKLKVKKFMESPNFIVVDYEPCGNEDEAYRSVMENFGKDQFVIEEINGNMEFWRTAINIMKADNYDDIIISREILVDFMRLGDFSDELCNLISIIYSVPVEETDCKSITRFIGEICRINGLIHKLEYKDDEIKIFHQFDDRGIINTINETILKTMDMGNHHFVMKKGDKMTILIRK